MFLPRFIISFLGFKQMGENHILKDNRWFVCDVKWQKLENAYTRRLANNQWQWWWIDFVEWNTRQHAPTVVAFSNFLWPTVQLLVPCLGFCLLIVKEFLFYFNLYLNFTRNVLSVILYSIVNRISCRLVTQLPLLYTVLIHIQHYGKFFGFAFFTLMIQNFLTKNL